MTLKKIINISFYILIYNILSSCNQHYNSNYPKLVFQKMPNRKMIAIGATINGKKEGLWNVYDDSGNLSSQYIYLNNSIYGENVIYHDDGKTILAHGNLKNNIEEGEWVWYYNENAPSEKGVYNKGKKNGIWSYYLADGRLNRQILYNNDTQVSIILDNHLEPPVPPKKFPVDSNNRAYVTDSNGKEIPP